MYVVVRQSAALSHIHAFALKPLSACTALIHMEYAVLILYGHKVQNLSAKLICFCIEPASSMCSSASCETHLLPGELASSLPASVTFFIATWLPFQQQGNSCPALPCPKRAYQVTAVAMLQDPASHYFLCTGRAAIRSQSDHSLSCQLTHNFSASFLPTFIFPIFFIVARRGQRQLSRAGSHSWASGSKPI